MVAGVSGGISQTQLPKRVPTLEAVGPCGNRMIGKTSKRERESSGTRRVMLTALLLVTLLVVARVLIRNRAPNYRARQANSNQGLAKYKRYKYDYHEQTNAEQKKIEKISSEQLFRLPQGKHLPWAKSVNDAVRWGFLTKKELEDFESHYDLERLTPEIKEKVKSWQLEKRNTHEYNERRYKDLSKVRSHIKNIVNLSSKHCVKPRYKNDDVFTKYSNKGLCWYDKKSFWGAQCLALSRIKSISKDFSCFEFNKKKDTLLGSPADNLYPLVSGADDAYFLYSLIYDFGYGPNLFAWHEERIEEDELKGKVATLYLVEIDVGKLTKGDSYLVYKVGITTKNNVTGSSAGSRYGGKYKEFTRVIRKITYEDGRIAYMKEQTIINMAHQEKSNRSRDSKFNVELLSLRDTQTLGVSEWIQEGKQGNAAIRLFDQIATAYS
jgi:hypothetical protein